MKERKLDKSWMIIIDRCIKLLSIKITHPEKSKIYFTLQLLQKWSDCAGSQGTKKWKNISDYLVRWIMLGRPDPTHSCFRKRKGVVRVPKKFSWVFSVPRRNGQRGVIFVITVLSIHRLVRNTPLYDVSTIVNPSRFGWWTLYKYIKEFRSLSLRSLFERRCGNFRVENLHWPLKERSGVTGTPSWNYYQEELECIVNSNLRWPWYFLYSRLTDRIEDETLRQQWKDLPESVSRKRFGKGFWQLFFQKPICLGKWNKAVNSRLAFLSDKSGKTRVVAIGDVWSQLVLKPYHDYVFRFLKTHECDGTHDQDFQRERIRRWTKDPKRKLYCFDLTAATDRIPCTLQGWLLFQAGVITSLTELVAWYVLMAHRNFHFTVKKGKVKSKWVNKVVRYSVGQPMGLYSSWASLALFHHCVVWLAAKRAGFKRPLSFRSYSIVGDDIVISNCKVAAHYQSIFDELDVGINLTKSFIGYGYAEYMKTLFVGGNIVSTLPLESLKLRQPYIVEDTQIILEDLFSRGIYLTLESFISSLDLNKHKKLSELYIAITCPDNKVYYPTELWSLGGADSEYVPGYIQFRRSIANLKAFKPRSLTSFHEALGSYALPKSTVTPHFQRCEKDAKESIKLWLTPSRFGVDSGIGQGFTFWSFGKGGETGTRLASAKLFPWSNPPTDRKKSDLALRRESFNAGIKITFGKSLGLSGDNIQAVDFYLYSKSLPISRLSR